MWQKKPEFKFFFFRRSKKNWNECFCQVFCFGFLSTKCIYFSVSISEFDFVAIAVIVFVCRRFGFKHVNTITIKEKTKTYACIAFIICSCLRVLLKYTLCTTTESLVHVLTFHIHTSIYTNIHTVIPTHTYACTGTITTQTKQTNHEYLRCRDNFKYTERTEHTKCNCQISHYNVVYWATIQMISCVL